jgi:hypothetical protein
MKTSKEQAVVNKGYAHRECCRLKHDTVCFIMKLEICYDVMSFNLSPVNSA